MANDTELLELYLTPLTIQRFQVLPTQVPGRVGEVPTECALPFWDGERDWRTTLIKALESSQGFCSENFPEPGEQAWLESEGLLLPDGEDFDLKQIGQALYRSLFPPDSSLKQTFRHALHLAEQHNTDLHLRLKFPADSAQRSRLADYPWELLHDGQRFLLHQRVQLSRYIAADSAPSKFTTQTTIRVLLVSARPQGLPQLSLEERAAIQIGLKRAQDTGSVELEILPSPTRKALNRYLTDCSPEQMPHVLHFDGHGVFGKRCTNQHCLTMHPGIKAEICRDCKRQLPAPQGYLAFETEQGKPDYQSATQIAAALQPYPIGLVVLSACQSGMAVAGDSVFNGMAQNLIDQQIPAVVAMQYSVRADAARDFSEQFYRELGNRKPLLRAVNQGRREMNVEGNQWYRPVLYLRWQDDEGGQLFESVPDKAGWQKIAARHIISPERALNPSRVFISYRSQEPDVGLAQTFHDVLTLAGHQIFMAGENIRIGENWTQRISNELEQCNYFLLLLSPQSAVSEMVIEEVRRIKELRESRTEAKPIILPIRVNFPLDSPLNYELRGYLNQIQQREWRSPENTTKVLQEVLNILANREEPIPADPREPFAFQGDSDPDVPPLPVAEPELQREPGGTVPLDSGLYVERPPIEADCYREISQPGALIRIKAPRQMGKTSLMARILNYAKAEGYQVVALSFQRADGAVFEDLDQLLRWFSEQVGRRLKRLNQLDEYWSKGGSKDKCHFYFEECLLEEMDTPLVLAIDEVDRVFPYRQVADDFFALLRSWFEAARIGDYSSELWQKFRLVIVHSTEVYVPLNINQSPFNVGKNVELPEFNLRQVQDLTQRYGLQWREEQVDQLMAVIGGHPYLVRKALYHIRRQDITLAQLLEAAPTEAGIYSDHLRRHLLNLQQYPQLAEALRQVVMKSKPVEIEAEDAFKLDSMGLIKLQGNQATPRCDLYRQYFRDHLKA